MIYKYFDFINEGISSEKEPIYYDTQLNEIMKYQWVDFSSEKYKDDIYFIKFKAEGEPSSPYYSVLVKKETNDIYMMEDNVADKFIQKFKTDFYKNPQKYVKQFKKFKPKCIGDWDSIESSMKYNL